MKKNDLILIIVIAFICISVYAGIRIFSHNGNTVIISADNNVLYNLPLDTDTSIRIPFHDNEYNDIVIKDGEAYVSAASCPDKICVNHPAIKNSGETIVCLPHRLVVRISDDNTIERSQKDE